MKFEHIRTMNWENAIRGMRNPKDSWNLSDSYFGLSYNDDEEIKDRTHGQAYEITHLDGEIAEFASIGPKDMDLCRRLISGGTEHRKFLRQIFISVDITAPLYIWKEVDTYKVATTANSTSTMHTIEKKPITINSFEIDDFDFDAIIYDYNPNNSIGSAITPFINFLETLRRKYVQLDKQAKAETDIQKRMELVKRAKIIWKELIRWLPEGWLQTRTYTMSYETALSELRQRDHHKLTEWDSIRKMLLSLPYMETFYNFSIKKNEEA